MGTDKLVYIPYDHEIKYIDTKEVWTGFLLADVIRPLPSGISKTLFMNVSKEAVCRNANTQGSTPSARTIKCTIEESQSLE